MLYKRYPADKLPAYVERFLPYGIPVQFRYDYTETTPENLYDEEHDQILHDLRRLFTYKGLDGCRMRNGFHFEYKGLQNGEIHSDWTGVKMDVDAYRKVVYEPYDLKVLNGTIDF